MARELGLSVQTMFADLIQRCLDAEFDRDFPENGSFSRKERKGRAYWYYQGYGADGRKYTKYVGPADDPAIAERVGRFRELKADFGERRRIVQALRAAGLPVADPLTGGLVEALWKAGMFRLRAALVGTVAFRTYAGLIGVRLPGDQLRTTDLDVAQFHAISSAVENSLPPILAVLKVVDPSFRAVPHRSGRARATRFRNATGYLVEFLTPNVGGDRHQGRPARMPALGGAGAEPLRFLDFLIHRPVRSVVLHAGGVPVLVPAPERYAVHKLIVAAKRREDPDGRAKTGKDVAQAATLVEAMAATRRHELTDAWTEAWRRGPHWRRALREGWTMLAAEAGRQLAAAVRRTVEERGQKPDETGFTEKDAGQES
jgi:hypothetical protein